MNDSGLEAIFWLIISIFWLLGKLGKKKAPAKEEIAPAPATSPKEKPRLGPTTTAAEGWLKELFPDLNLAPAPTPARPSVMPVAAPVTQTKRQPALKPPADKIPTAKKQPKLPNTEYTRPQAKTIIPQVTATPEIWKGLLPLNRDKLRQGFILREILGPPQALKNRLTG